MKKIFLLFLMLVGTLSIHADDAYPYLTFETTDGAKASVAVDSLSLSIKGTTLRAGDKQFTLSNLSKMYFSTEDETTAGIENVNDNDNYIEVYDLQGKKVESEMVNGKWLNGKLPRGIYIVKMKDKTYKLMVR
ncbi:MAG: T9SS type A sorting domain-containing protein [Bacteroidaceae bacterium]|nr:T9SS type A sorting domain-containing protein [Bacteroidaceae bacterium]